MTLDDELHSGARLSLLVTTTARSTEVAVAGEIDLSSAGHLRQCLSEELQLAPRALLLDLAAVTFCSVDGARALIDATLAARQADIPLAITSGSHAVDRVIALLGLEQALPTQRSPAQDHEQLGGSLRAQPRGAPPSPSSSRRGVPDRTRSRSR